MSDAITNLLDSLLRALHGILPDWAYAALLVLLMLIPFFGSGKGPTARGTSGTAYGGTHATTINVNVTKDGAVTVTKNPDGLATLLPDDAFMAERRRKRLREIASLAGEEGEELLVL